MSDGMRDGRFPHEDTATDRWVGAMLEVSRRDDPARVDALVGRAVGGIRAGRARGWGWRAPLAAAASIAVFVGAVLFLSPQPASAGALLRAAQVAERSGGDRRYRIELEFPARPGGGPSPTASGTLDLRGTAHVRLDLRFTDGRSMVRATDGTVAWTLSPSGEVLRVRDGAHWPRFIETPDGDLLVDRLDAMLGDIGAFYSIERCDSGGEMRLCAQRAEPGFRGPERIELTLDPATKSVRRAVMRFDELPPPGDAGPHGPPGPPGPPPEGGAGPHPPRRMPPPTRIEITRVDPPQGGLDASRFAPPAEPVREAPERPDGPPFRRPGSSPRARASRCTCGAARRSRP